MQDLYEYPGRLIAIIHRKTQIQWNHELKQYGVTVAEIPVLLQLFLQEAMTQDQIAMRLALDKSAVTRSIQSLKDKGFLEKRKDESDLRCNRIFLTEKGAALQGSVFAIRERVSESIMSRMNPEEQKEFMRLLHIAAEGVTLENNTCAAASQGMEEETNGRT